MRRAWTASLALWLLLLSLACNFPGFPGAATLTIPATEALTEATPSGEGPENPVDDVLATPAPLETATPEGFSASPTPTRTSTVTPTPSPTATPTPEAVEPGPPLAFAAPAWTFRAWQQIEGTSDWEGEIEIHVTGGRPPYRAQLEDRAIVDGLIVTARWQLCRAMPATIRVWSADGQAISQSIWVSGVGCDD